MAITDCSRPTLEEFTSVEPLLRSSADWNDLVNRSESAVPTLSAGALAQWIEHFSPNARLRSLLVEEDGRLVAALPLVERRWRGLLPIGELPVNEWALAGDLLLDDSNDSEVVLDQLVHGLKQTPWPIVQLDAVRLESARYQRLLAALNRAGLSWRATERFEVNEIEIQGDWQTYEDSWSGNHRRHMRKALKRAQAEGGADLLVVQPETGEEVRKWLQQGFEIEDRSWKGEASQSSVLRTPGMFDFYVREATQLAERGQLALTFLMHQDRAIAFEYGWRSRGVYFTPKVGYDAAFSQLSPGQLLRRLLIEQLFRDEETKLVDFFGPASEATDKWSTRRYTLSRVLIATNRRGAALLRAVRLIRRGRQ